MVHYTLKVMWSRYNLQNQKGRRGLISFEMCVETEENNMAWYYYIRNSKERLMKVVRKTKIHNCTVEKLRKRMNSNSDNSTPNRQRIEVAIVTTPGFTLIVCLDIYRFNNYVNGEFCPFQGQRNQLPLVFPNIFPLLAWGPTPGAS